MHILYSTPYMQGEACVISFVPQQNIQLLWPVFDLPYKYNICAHNQQVVM